MITLCRKAVNLLQQQRQRQKTYRPPAISDNDDYERFEQEFAFTPTADQVKCFKVSISVIFPLNFMTRLPVRFGVKRTGHSE